MKLCIRAGIARKRQAGEVDRETIITIASFIVLAVFAVLMLLGFSHSGSSGFGSKLLVVVAHNMAFWIIIVIGAVFGVYRKLTNPGAFMWRELPIQLAASVMVTFLLFLLFFSTATDLIDTEVWNGYARQSEYHEEWTERVTTTTTDSKGNTETHVSYVYHPPYWLVSTTIGDIGISSTEYAAYRGRYGNETEQTEFHLNQSSFGDGNMYYVNCDVAQASRMPVSVERFYVNYLRASDSIKKLRGNTEAYKKYLRPYPRVHSSPFGNIELDRVIVADAPVPPGWAASVSQKLSVELEELAARKEVNILVYVVGTSDRGFSGALREMWVQGKKNDVVVILGAPNFPKVDWAEVMCWTKVEEFPITLRDRFVGQGGVSNPAEVVSAIIGEVSKPPEKGGYQRTHMRDLEYLVAEISLPWWCQVIVIVIGAVASWFVSVWVINNDMSSSGAFRGQSRSFQFGRNR